MEGSSAEVSSQEGSQEDPKDADDRKLASDTLQLIKIFPEEIWLMITDHITEFNELEKVSNTSLFFRSLLLPRQSLFLFPKVWEIFEGDGGYYKQCEVDYESKYGEYEDIRFREEHGITCKSCGRTRTPRSYSEILKLRLICKTWNVTIDRFYEARRHHYKISTEMHPEEQGACHWRGIAADFRNDETVENFMLHFRTTHQSENRDKSPFISGKVFIMSDEDDDNELAVRQGHLMVTLLQQYGHHLLFATVYFNDSIDQLTVPVYSKIREWLNLMPNLRTLEVGYWSHPDVEIHEASEDVQAEVHQNSMPGFENLQRLCTRALPSVIFNSLIRRNNHVSILEVKRDTTTPNYDFCDMRMPNLEELAVQISIEDEFFELVESQVTWPLTNLHLDFARGVYIAWTQIFDLIHDKWANTLKFLTLKLPKPKLDRESRAILVECLTMRLNLPGLQRLKVLLTTMTSLDFILPLKGTLEKLDIVWAGNGDLDEMMARRDTFAFKMKQKQEIQLIGYHKRLYQSNVWELFPKLQEITLSQKNRDKRFFSIYTRDKWEALQKPC